MTIDMDTDTDAIVSRRSGSSPGQARRIMTGDRFCTKCGYNLVGQEIVREEHYALLIVRCPECATVTGLQDYPRLGIWAARWGIVLAALWMILLLCMWPATSGIMLGFGIGITDEGSRAYARRLDDLQTMAEAQAATPATPATPKAPEASATPAATTTSTPPAVTPPPLPMFPGQALPAIVTSRGTTIVLGGGARFGSSAFKEWWEQQDQQAVLAAAGGWWGVFDRVEFLMLIPAGAVVFGLGCFWSVFLMQVPRRWLVYCVAAIVGLACVFALIPLLDSNTRTVFSARRAAQYQLALPTISATFGALIVPLSLGLWLGRPLVKLAVSALLPPRLRGPIAVLWTAEK